MRFDELNRLEDYFTPMVLSADSKARRQELADLLTDAFLYFFSVYEVHRMYNSMLEKALYEQLLVDQISDAVSKVTGIDSEMSNHIRTLAKEVVDTTYKNANKNNKTQVRQTPQNSEDINLTALDESEESLDSPNTASDSHIQDILAAEDEEEEEEIVEQMMEDEAVDEYWLSIKRAMNIAYSEANTFFNYTDYVEAKSRGYQYKTWRTMNDPKVRDTHEEADGQTVGIDEPFIIGNSEMRFPHDWESDPDPREVINCRCAVDYK